MATHDADIEDPESTFILARTSNEKTCFRTLQPVLKKIKIVVQPIKQTNVLFICHEDQWKRRINQYMKEIGVFTWIRRLALQTANNRVQYILTNMSNEVVSTLHSLFLSRAITTEQYGQMMYYNQSTQFQVNQLGFIPELSRKKILIQPSMTCFKEDPIKAIACFINILLQPLIECVIRSKTLPTGSEAIQAFEGYVKRGYLQPTTLFVTMHIHDLCTTLPHHLILEKLQEFLHTYAENRQIEGTSTTTIVRLVQLILENQFCVYESNLYQQTAGCSVHSSLIIALVDIYLFYLQHNLVSVVTKKKELFGRSLNQLFFTWNESKDELLTLLDRIDLTNSTYTHIQITTSIDLNLQYLDAEIGHDEGLLYTRVYHDSNLEPYAVPYVLETTASQSHLFLLRAALIRSILYCSNVVEFENERLFIDLCFIINDISMSFIQKTYENFLIEFHLFRADTCMDENTYQGLRQRIRQYHQRRTQYHLRQRQRRRRRRLHHIIP